MSNISLMRVTLHFFSFICPANRVLCILNLLPGFVGLYVLTEAPSFGLVELNAFTDPKHVGFIPCPSVSSNEDGPSRPKLAQSTTLVFWRPSAMKGPHQ